jgi:GT2 family glycosyltransferase
VRAVKPLAIIPAFSRNVHDVAVLETCVSSLRRTAKDACDLLVVDDGSPDAEAAEASCKIVEGVDGEFHACETNEGFSHAVNIGLRRALQEGRDAILVNADIEFFTSTWLELMVKQPTSNGEGLASVVGALLLYPNETIQHAGVFFSLLCREFDHIYRYGPRNLPEALNAKVCPVTGALQFIRHDCLAEIGLYDETFRMGWEDVDYCLRVWRAGRECIYQPGVQAIHHESFFRGAGRQDAKIASWQALSWARFAEKWAGVNFGEFVPNLV